MNNEIRKNTIWLLAYSIGIVIMLLGNTPHAVYYPMLLVMLAIHINGTL